MARPPRVLTETDYRTLERLVHAQQRQITSLSNRLAAYGMRRHQGVYMPSSAAHLCSASKSSSTTISVTGSVTQIDMTAITTSDEFSLSSGIVTASRAGIYRVEFDTGAVFSEFRRNDSLVLQFRVQQRDDPLDSWSSLFTVQRTTWFPDVAIGSFSTNTYNEHAAQTTQVTVGMQFRVAYNATVTSTLGTVSTQSAEMRFVRGL